MGRQPTAPPKRESVLWDAAVWAGAALIALGGARPYAGGWNDGSRLATVEALVDHHTLAIDRSAFVRVPPDAVARGAPPYSPREPGLLETGTLDKLLIRGHFYSDKPAVVSALMAVPYQLWEWCGGPPAARRPDLYCLLMTLTTSGAAYAAAVGCVFQLGRRVGLPPAPRLALTASFALATTALTYTRLVNNHVMLLGVGAALMLNLVGLGQELRDGRRPWFRLVVLGTLAGLGYCLDLGTGPALLACGFVLLVYRCRRFAPVAVAAAAALPWVAAHHALNYAIGGVFKPINAVPDYLAWPGSPFSPDNMTGVFHHGPLPLLVYAAGLLYGKQGFLTHNLPLLLLFPALGVVLRPAMWRAEAVFAAAWCAGTWLMYALFSNNYGGACCSVRWFVPLLAPLYYLLVLFLRDRPEYRADCYVLSAWGLVLGLLMWWDGPWRLHMVPFLWPVQGGALLSWLICRIWGWRRGIAAAPAATEPPRGRLVVSLFAHRSYTTRRTYTTNGDAAGRLTTWQAGRPAAYNDRQPPVGRRRGGDAMPVHDWTRVSAGIFHDFHVAWIAEIRRALNGGLLPQGYYALAEQIAGGLGPDVLTLQGPTADPPPPNGDSRGVALADAPPRVWHRGRAEEDVYAARAKAVVIRHASGHRVVAMVEIVSPGNKNTRHGLRNFVEKAVEVLRGGVHLLIVDLFPPGPRDPQGVHKAVWDEYDETGGFALPSDRPLTLAAYIGGRCPEAFVEPTAVGRALPDMPLFLTPEVYIPLPLEATYRAAWEGVPAFWRDVVEGRTRP
jgi:hypothetical protein